jgi:hypothetical protein
MFREYTLPTGASLVGAGSAFCALFIFAKEGIGLGDALLIAFMSATMGAAFFYFVAMQILKTFGLFPDTTVEEFHRFLWSDDPR